MSDPSTNTDANGKLVNVGNGVVLTGTVSSVSNGQATILLTDAYAPESVSVTVPCASIRQQKSKS
jgi:hypothetical protein